MVIAQLGMCGVIKKSYGNLYNLCMQVRERSDGCSLIGQLLTGWCMLCFGASPSVIMMSRCQILVPCEGDGVGERLPCVLLSEAPHVPEREGRGPEEYVSCYHLSCCCWKPGR